MLPEILNNVIKILSLESLTEIQEWIDGNPNSRAEFGDAVAEQIIELT